MTTVHPPWKESRDWLLFSLAIAVYVAVMCLVKVGIYGALDADYYWHVTLGKYIVTNRSIFRTDIFSWFAEERGYVETAHSWLGSVIIYLFSRITSNQLVNIGFFVAISTACIAFIMVYRYGCPLEKSNARYNTVNCCFGTFAGAILLKLTLVARPQYFGLILFILEIILLHDGFEKPESRKCWFMPLIALLWANMHGGSLPVMFAFQALFAGLSFLKPFSWKGFGQTSPKTNARIKRFILLLAADFVAVLINPYGWKILIYSFFTNNSATKRQVMEWFPAKLLEPVAVIALLALLGMLLLRKEEKTVELSYVLPVFATLFMYGKYSRIEPYVIITTVMMLWHWIKVTFDGCEIQKEGMFTVRGFAGLMFGAAIVTTIFVWQFLVCDTSLEERSEDPVTPELMQVLDELQPKRMYSHYNIGGCLIYHGYKSFIDSRADLFPGDVLNAALDFSNIYGFSSDELEKYIEDYGFDAMLLLNGERISAWMETRDDWAPVFHDGKVTLYIPAESAAGSSDASAA